MEKENYSKGSFEDVIGQDLAIKLLRSAIKKEHIANAYLFYGAKGIGKKLTAARFSEAILSMNSKNTFIRSRIESRNHPDLLWIEPTYVHKGNLIARSKAKQESHSFRSLPQIRIEQIKDIKQFLGRKPIEAHLGIVIIENIENINESASNALLKTLEEPNNGIFILTTERRELLLSTICSRCQGISFNRLSSYDIKQILEKDRTKSKQELEDALHQKELLALSNGSPGAILQNMDKWNEIPKDLWPKIKNCHSNNPIDALSTAKEISEFLDSEQQIWLISWLQQYIWLKNTNAKEIKVLEKLKFHIKSFVNPRLAWEIALLKLHEAY